MNQPPIGQVGHLSLEGLFTLLSSSHEMNAFALVKTRPCCYAALSDRGTTVIGGAGSWGVYLGPCIPVSCTSPGAAPHCTPVR
jgi:hypothetical protein